MTYHIDIQHASQETIPVDDDTLIHWAQLALETAQDSAELTLRIVDEAEITALNGTYRKQNKATNVLAFPSHLPATIELDCPFLGDVILCPTVIQYESIDLKKPLEAHWALIVIHGILHLLGYDHIQDKDADIMQGLEKKLLLQLGFDDPYLEDDEIE